MARPNLLAGVFSNGIPFVRFGTGPKLMLFLAGGPGNTVPSGFAASGFVRGMRAFTDEYSIVLVLTALLVRLPQLSPKLAATLLLVPHAQVDRLVTDREQPVKAQPP
jgi:hypothetical protein